MRILIDFKGGNYINFSLDDYPHTLICGSTNSGKTYFSLFFLAKIAKYYPDSVIYILDFKGDDKFSCFENANNYYYYKQCSEGLEKVYQEFSKRLNTLNQDYEPIILFFDELASFLNHYPKAEKEKYQIMISEMLMMGRSKKVHLIVSTQRPDSELFKYGAREQFSLKIVLGSVTAESKKMIFPHSELQNPSLNQGCGHISMNGGDAIEVIMPIIYDMELIQETILEKL